MRNAEGKADLPLLSERLQFGLIEFESSAISPWGGDVSKFHPFNHATRCPNMIFHDIPLEQV